MGSVIPSRMHLVWWSPSKSGFQSLTWILFTEAVAKGGVKYARLLNLHTLRYVFPRCVHDSMEMLWTGPLQYHWTFWSSNSSRTAQLEVPCCRSSDIQPFFQWWNFWINWLSFGSKRLRYTCFRNNPFNHYIVPSFADLIGFALQNVSASSGSPLASASPSRGISNPSSVLYSIAWICLISPFSSLSNSGSCSIAVCNSNSMSLNLLK